MSKYISLTIIEARSLPRADFMGKSDPYCKVYWLGKKYKTTVKKKTLSPVWNETFMLPAPEDRPERADLEVWDYGFIKSNKIIGCAKFSTTQEKEEWMPLNAGGDIKIKIFFPPLYKTSSFPHPSQPLIISGVNGEREGEPSEELILKIKRILPQCSYEDISRACIATGNAEEDTIEMMLRNSENINNKNQYYGENINNKNQYYGENVNNKNQYYGENHENTYILQNINTQNNNSSPNRLVHPPSISTGGGKAVLVGINYTGREALKGCRADIVQMRKLLISHYYFDPQNIRILTDELGSAGKGEILANLRWLGENREKTDFLFFHFSGHGSQQSDPTGMESDGYDEVILPSDHRSAGVITDDEINRLIVQPLPGGCRLTAVMDCCHSGTGMDLPYSWIGKKGEWEEEDNPFFVPSDVVLISGCKDHGTSADIEDRMSGERGGALTLALVQVLKPNPFNHSFSSLLESVKERVHLNGVDQKVQLSSTQPFPLSRPFDLDSVVPNRNSFLGRKFQRKKRRWGMGMNNGGSVTAALVTGFIISDILS